MNHGVLTIDKSDLEEEKELTFMHNQYNLETVKIDASSMSDLEVEALEHISMRVENFFSEQSLNDADLEEVARMVLNSDYPIVEVVCESQEETGVSLYVRSSIMH